MATQSSGNVIATSDTTVVLQHTAGAETAVTLVFSGVFARAVAVGAYRGVNPTSPIDAQTTTSASSATSLNFASLTTTAAGDRLIVLSGANATAAGNWTPPSAMTARAQASAGSPVVAIDDQGILAAGATGSRTASYSRSAELAGVAVALKPAATQPTATSYRYDNRGNRTSVTPPSGSATTLGYDQANRLTSYTNGTASATYTYSGDSLRMSKTSGGTTSAFAWDLTGSLPQLLSDGTNSYIYGPSGHPIEQIAAGAVTYYHHDQLGSTRALTSATGAVVGTFTYDSYGRTTGSTGTITTPLGYAGQYTDAESGLIHLRARYYDPSTAQFLTRDPAVATTGQPYSYGDDNPTNEVDPTGLYGYSFSWDIGNAGPDGPQGS